jgi:hypothetical protein
MDSRAPNSEHGQVGDKDYSVEASSTGSPEDARPSKKERKSRPPDHKRFSIGPQILFIISTDKTEEYTTNIKTKLHSKEDNWSLAKLLWHYAEEWMVSDVTKDQLKGYLATAQYHSLTMLHDWIHSKHEIEPVVRPFAQSLFDTETELIIHESLDDSETLKDCDSHIMSEDFRQISLYQKVMADLFRMEFSPAHWVGEQYRSGDFKGIKFQRAQFEELDYCRRQAWQVCSAQRISWKFTSVSWGEGIENASNSKIFTNPHGRNDPCPWLKRDKSREGFPRYLWDISLKKTVDTAEFTRRVNYTCISHTWGRWRKKDWINITGVPWRVPLNSRFNIEELPTTFYNMKDRFATEYIWLDLFCMPQETTNPKLAEILKSEIARQAVIFQNASACVAWLNYVNHWVGEYCTIGWLSAKFAMLGSLAGMTDASSLLEAACHGSSIPLQLTRLARPMFGSSKWRAMAIQWADDMDVWWRKQRKITPYYHFEPSDWFSGVWTLQEAYLRPNMVLADKDWNILSDASGEPIALEELFALDYVVWQLMRWGTQVLGRFIIKGHGVEDWPFDEVMQVYANQNVNEGCPPGPRQLHSMIQKTHLFSEGTGSRLDPLIQANARFCTAGATGRAEAIMSSLGVTDWFKADSVVKEKDLVMGMYPNRFLQEALGSIGPDFYMTSIHSPTIWPVLNLLTQQTGSMMPFDRAKESLHKMDSIKTRGSLPYHDPTALDPSVATWEIERTGRVVMKQAVVLASNKSEFPGMEGNGYAYMSFWGALYSKSCEYEFSEWIQQQPRYLDTFIVALTNNNPVSIVGLLLQGKGLGKKTRLAKIGTFELAIFGDQVKSWPDAQQVDWVVL